MTYDLYSYRPETHNPSCKEAVAVFSTEEDSVFRDDDEARATKERIAAALIEFNPKLERFRIDFEAVCKAQNISIEEARARFNHIELNPPRDELAIQLTIHWDHVGLEFPYWYSGSQRDAVFNLALDYMKLIRQVAGFFGFDPQTEAAFDPATIDSLDHSAYSRIVEIMPNIVAKTGGRKPWWKFW
jgi:hypothetical protein